MTPQEELESATAQLLIELAFLLPKGTNVITHPMAAKLAAWKRAITRAAVLDRPAPPQTQRGDCLGLNAQEEADAMDAYLRRQRAASRPAPKPARLDSCSVCHGRDMVFKDGKEWPCPNADCWQGLVKNTR